MLSFIGIHPANSQRMADASAQLMYQKRPGQCILQDAAQLGSSHCLQKSKTYARIGQHLPAAKEENLATCTPADLLVYMESHWLPNHAGTMLPDGSVIASPSGCLSHLSTGFLLIGRDGDWDPSNGTGNPVVSTDLT